MKKIILILALLIFIAGVARAQTAIDEYRARTGQYPENFKTGTTSSDAISKNSYNYSGVPTGAVLPFDLGGRCPEGWSVWNKASGRVIVGTGERDGEKYRHYQIGGKAKTEISAESIKTGRTMLDGISVKVREDQTPPYVLVANTSVVDEQCIEQERHCTRYPGRPYTVKMGSDNVEPFDNRQPWIALTYCRKN